MRITVYDIHGNTPETKRYTPSTFIDMNGCIYVHNLDLGLFEHGKLNTTEKLKQHIDKMLAEGFTVTVNEIKTHS